MQTAADIAAGIGATEGKDAVGTVVAVSVGTAVGTAVAVSVGTAEGCAEGDSDGNGVLTPDELFPVIEQLMRRNPWAITMEHCVKFVDVFDASRTGARESFMRMQNDDPLRRVMLARARTVAAPGHSSPKARGQGGAPPVLGKMNTSPVLGRRILIVF